MTTHNGNNERIKRHYFKYLKEAKRQNEQTVDSVAKALNRFKVYTKYRISKNITLTRPLPSRKTWQSRRTSGPEIILARRLCTRPLHILKDFLSGFRVSRVISLAFSIAMLNILICPTRKCASPQLAVNKNLQP